MNSRDARIIMTRELTEISVTRKDTAEAIAKMIINNFTTREIAMIAEAIQQGSGIRLLQLIKR